MPSHLLTAALLALGRPRLPDSSLVRGNTGGPSGALSTARLIQPHRGPFFVGSALAQRELNGALGSAPQRARAEERMLEAAQRASEKFHGTNAEAAALRLSLEEALLVPVDLAEPTADEALWPWQAAMVAITACWGANFAVTSWSMQALGGASTDGELLVAARFVVGAVALLPFLASATSAAAVGAGVQVGLLCSLGYASQAAALSLGTQPGTAAFICSLQSVVVALMAARSGAGVARATWLAVALSVAGVACLELPSALSGGGGGAFCVGDLIALGQPVGFGLSYVVLEEAMADHPDDELPIAALQCVVIAVAAVAAASVDSGAAPWSLPWEHLLAATAGGAPAWGVPAAVAYTGLVSTSLTIWLTAKVFAKLPSTDASVILASEPLWATGVAVALLGAPVGPSDAVGGALILGGLACNQGLLDRLVPGLADELAEHTASPGGMSRRRDEAPPGPGVDGARERD